MKSTLLIFSFTLLVLSVTAQNPLIIKTVNGTALDPKSRATNTWGAKPWKGKMFYQGTGTASQCLLAVTDGTASGTLLITDLGNMGDITNFIAAQDYVFFTTLGTVLVSSSPVLYNYDRKLWRTDGTAAGTVLLKSFDQSNSYTNSGIFWSDAAGINNYSVSGNTIFFNGYDAAAGPEVWKSDGTVSGTQRVKDIASGTLGSNPYAFCHVGGNVCFFAREAGSNYQLWKTDGTEAGTQILTIINPAGSPAEAFCGLYKGKMWFWANDGINGAELWTTDGTAGGTQLFKDLVPGNNFATGSGGMRTDLMFLQDDRYLYFTVERHKYVWRTDGTAAGTVQLNNAAMTNAGTAGGSARGQSIYWAEGTDKLYYSDGNPANSRLVRSGLSYIEQLFNYRNAGWFAARQGFYDMEPWRSDGTAPNTARALDIYPGGFGSSLYSSAPGAYFELNNYLYFFASNAAGTHLFRYNGNFTFNNSQAGGRWRDSANWNSVIPPGVVDTAYIPAGATINVDGRTAYAGTLVMGSGSIVNLVSATDSLYINRSLQGTAATGNGVVALRNTGSDTVNVQAAFTAGRLSVQGVASLESNVSVSNNLNLSAGARLLANNSNITMSGSTSTITNATNSYVVTNGNGSFAMEAVGAGGRTGAVLYPVGTSSYYNPATLTNSGTADALSVRVRPGISNLYSGNAPSGGSYSSGAVNATWFINEGVAGGSNVTVGLQWNAAQELPGFDRSQSSIGHFIGGTWQLNTAGAATGSDPYTWSGSGYTSFSPFGVLNTNRVLPLQRIGLSVQKTAAGNRCVWNIIGDGGADITLEKSATGLAFTPAYSTAYASNGEWQDATPAQGKTYYRLKVAERNGVVRYSNIVWVDASARIAVYPTLFSSTIQVQHNGQGTLTVRLLSSSGQTVLRQNIQPGTTSIVTDKLAKGIYVYQITNEAGLLSSGTIIKTVN